MCINAYNMKTCMSHMFVWSIFVNMKMFWCSVCICILPLAVTNETASCRHQCPKHQVHENKYIIWIWCLFSPLRPKWRSSQHVFEWNHEAPTAHLLTGHAVNCFVTVGDFCASMPLPLEHMLSLWTGNLKGSSSVALFHLLKDSISHMVNCKWNFGCIILTQMGVGLELA